MPGWWRKGGDCGFQRVAPGIPVMELSSDCGGGHTDLCTLYNCIELHIHEQTCVCFCKTGETRVSLDSISVCFPMLPCGFARRYHRGKVGERYMRISIISYRLHVNLQFSQKIEETETKSMLLMRK